jgi:hypothetical protein
MRPDAVGNAREVAIENAAFLRRLPPVERVSALFPVD